MWSGGANYFYHAALGWSYIFMKGVIFFHITDTIFMTTTPATYIKLVALLTVKWMKLDHEKAHTKAL